MTQIAQWASRQCRQRRRHRAYGKPHYRRSRRPPKAHQQYLTFLLGGEMYAVGILNVKEIIEYGNLTEIPMMPAFIRGVINLRGAWCR
jgi:chemotaxis signal transduction protein